jgi:hypothetical protein
MSSTYCHVYDDPQLNFGLEIGFIDQLWIVATLNYSAIAKFHTLQITRAQAKSCPACSVFTSSFLATSFNNGYSSTSMLKSSLNGGSLPTDSFLHRLPYRTDLVAPVDFLMTSRHCSCRQHHYHMRIRCSGNLFTESFPSSGCLFLLIKNLLPSDGRRSVVWLSSHECYFRAVC